MLKKCAFFPQCLEIFGTPCTRTTRCLLISHLSTSFSLLQHIPLNLPESLPIFELLVQESEELPQVCVGVHSGNHGSGKAVDHLRFNIIPLDDAPRVHPGTHACTHTDRYTEIKRNHVLAMYKILNCPRDRLKCLQ